jgi:uncharacterized protein YoxC
MGEIAVAILVLTLMLAFTVIRHMRNKLKYLEQIIKKLQNELASLRRRSNN